MQRFTNLWNRLFKWALYSGALHNRYCEIWAWISWLIIKTAFYFCNGSNNGAVTDANQTSDVLFCSQPICTRRDNETRRLVHLTVAGIWINLHHVGLTQAFGQVRDVGVQKEWAGGGGGSDSFPARKKHSSFVKKKKKKKYMHALRQCKCAHWLTFLSGSHRLQMRTDERVCRTPLINCKQKLVLNLATLRRIVFTHYCRFHLPLKTHILIQNTSLKQVLALSCLQPR